MTPILLTQDKGAFLGPIAKFLGWIMNGVYNGLCAIGIENIGLSIIILTIIIYTCLIPLTYQQQKFSFMSRVMNPEIQAIQKKYKGKKDQASMQKMNEETQAVYAKYGVNAMGSCIQLLIQMPILFALYRVMYNIPAYVKSLRELFNPLVDGIMGQTGYRDAMTGLMETQKIRLMSRPDFTVEDTTAVGNYIVDVVYKLSNEGWNALTDAFPALTTTISSVQEELSHLNYFLGLNISSAPTAIIKESFTNHHFGMVILALLVPVCSYLTQVLNIRLMPQANTAAAAGNGQADQMAQQMKMMNRTMPLFSLVLCFTVPVGLGLYWIASAVVRMVQQLIINRHFEKIDLDAVVKKNIEKNAVKARKQNNEKQGNSESMILNGAAINTRKATNLSKEYTAEQREEIVNRAREASKGAKAGSMTSKANMVKEFNERNNKN